MDDQQIVELYLERDEAAITELEKKYGVYCQAIVQRVLDNQEDVQETLNDIWLHLWNSIPSVKPSPLRPFVAKLARNLAIDRWRKNKAEKRGGQMLLALEELSDLVDGSPLPQEQAEGKDLERTIQDFLSGCTKPQRDVFLRRYFFFDSTDEIARRYAMRESNVLNLLSRTKKKLKEYLKKEGYSL